MIQTTLNGMITLLLAKFMLNDVPHYLFEDTTMRQLKVVRVDDRLATPSQLRYIASLCQRLQITVPYEEQVKTSGEAGRLIRELETEEKHRKKLKGGNPSSNYEVVVTEVEDFVTAHIPGVRAAAELSRLSQTEATLFDLEPDNWLWFNRLINQSGIPRIGALLLDEVIRYCGKKNYSIVNQVSAYGDISQKELEDWYIRKGFVPVDYKKYGNTLLKWVPQSSNPGRRLFIGTCVDNPFGDIHILDQVIGPDAEEITKQEFLNNTQASAEEVASPGLRFFKSRDYFWRSRPNVYFYRDYLPPHEYAGVEHFFSFSWRGKPR